jgi:hypothetical protein
VTARSLHRRHKKDPKQHTRLGSLSCCLKIRLIWSGSRGFGGWGAAWPGLTQSAPTNNVPNSFNIRVAQRSHVFREFRQPRHCLGLGKSNLRWTCDGFFAASFPHIALSLWKKDGPNTTQCVEAKVARFCFCLPLGDGDGEGTCADYTIARCRERAVRRGRREAAGGHHLDRRALTLIQIMPAIRSAKPRMALTRSR